MNCLQCGELNPDEARFCMYCGAALSVADPEGPARLQSMLKSIPEPLKGKIRSESSKIIGARKPVTILFADIVDSTPLAEKLDPEEWREIVEGVHQRVSEAVYQYEGTIAQLLGDGVLVFFGAPITHEDDPVRAVHAALDMQVKINRFQEELNDVIAGLKIRVGINTGPVVVDAIGTDMHMEYLAIGDAVNLAKRLEGAAEPGSVLISEQVNNLVSHRFQIEEVGDLKLKGIREKVRAFQVMDVLEKPGTRRGIAGMGSVLVGRETELGALQSLITHLKTGVGSIMTIVGEAGIGKSRLVAELRQSANGSDLRWLEGRCLSYGKTMPYHPWLNMLRNYFDFPTGSRPEETRIIFRDKLLDICEQQFEDVYPYLGHALGIPIEEEYGSHVEPLTGPDLKRNTFRAIELFLAGIADVVPAVIVCEDLHWADPTSIELLERLHETLIGKRLLFISVFRPDPAHASWAYRKHAAQRFSDNYVDIDLDPLSESSSDLLLENLLGFELMPQEFKSRILKHAEGNPFFVEEILRSLVDRGVLRKDEQTGQWQLVKKPGEIFIPESLHGVLLARVDVLQSEAKEVLQKASVIGRMFSYRVLEDVMKERPSLVKWLDRLTELDFIRVRLEYPEREYIFKHHLTWETTYQAILKKDRKAYHQEVGIALEQLFPDRIEENLGHLAYHWERTNDHPKAVDYLLRAGEHASRQYANLEAIDFYERALVILRDIEDHGQISRTLIKLGLLYHSVFAFEHSQRAYKEGADTWLRMSEEETKSPEQGTQGLLRMHWTAPEVWDHTNMWEPGWGGVVKLIFCGLMSVTPQFDVFPEIAHSWEVLDEGKRYVFKLRDDFFWSDGERVTAYDFEYAWKRILDPSRKSEVAHQFFVIKNAKPLYEGSLKSPDLLGVKAENPFTLIMDLERPASYLLYFLTFGSTFPVPKHKVEKHGDSWMEPELLVTNGPFRVLSLVPGESIKLQRKADHPIDMGGNLHGIEIGLTRSLKNGLKRYENNEIDAITWVHEEETKFLREMYSNDYITLPSTHLHYFAFNPSRSPFDDVRVRRAFAMAIDREALANEVLQGVATPATSGLIPPGIPGHSPGLGLDFDPEGARRLLVEAGYPDGRGFPEIEAISLGRRHHNIGEETDFLRDQWRVHLGIDIRWTDLESDDFYDRLEGHPQLYHFGSMSDFPDPISVLDHAILTNQWATSDPAYNAILRKAEKTFDYAQRLSLYQEADGCLINAAAIVPITHWQDHLMLKPWVKRFPMVMNLPGWREIVVEPH